MRERGGTGRPGRDRPSSPQIPSTADDKDILPAKVRNSLAKLGRDIAVARRRRGLTTAMMAERLAVGRATYERIERGDPGVASARVAMALYVLGLGTPFSDLAEPGNDETGTLLDIARLPKRIRPKRDPRPK